MRGPVLAHYREAERFYRFPFTAPWSHLALIGVLLAVLLFLGPKIWRHSEAERLAMQPGLENLQRAIALEPDRAEYRDQLGRIYLFSLANYDPKRAAESLQRAVELNPAVAEYWLDLATAYDSMGRKQDSVKCVETARQHDPRNPQIAWSTGNIRAEAGDTPGALEAWREAILEQPDQLTSGLDLAWKVAPDTQLLLDHLVPPTNEADFTFLDFLIQGQAGKPDLVWNRIVARGQPFPPRLATNYFHALFQPTSDLAMRHDIDKAKQAWSQLRHMMATSGASSSQEGGSDGDGSLPAPSPSRFAGDNLITNGGFEAETLNMGFDWTWDSPKGATLVWDQSVVQEGKRSARIDFDGTERLIFTGLRQLVPVEPGHHYRLTCYLRGERIKGGAGIRLEVARYGVDQRIEPLAHGREVFQTAGWVPDSIEFTVPPKTYLLSVQAQRDLRGVLQSNVSGSFWLDNVVLRDMGAGESRGEQ